MGRDFCRDFGADELAFKESGDGGGDFLWVAPGQWRS